MISLTLLAVIASAAPAEAPSASVLLKATAPVGATCRATRVDGGLVRAALFSPATAQCAVASVGGEPIALRDLAEALEIGHLSRNPRAPAPAKRPSLDFTPALDRLITARLIVQEAREMRLDATPEFRQAVDDFKASRVRAIVQRMAAKGVKPEAGEVERLYRDAVREWKLTSVLLEKEADAKAFEAALKGGKGFDALVKQFVAEKKAKGGASEYAARKHMLPEVLAAVEQAKRGVPSGLVKVPQGWAVLRVDGVRYPAGDAKARAAAREASVARREREAVRRFYLAAVKKYATVDEKLVKALDLEAKGEKGFEALLVDARPLATIRGEQPVTVADLAREVGTKFFHGLETPIREHRVNREKDAAFERLLGSRLFAKEAAVRKLDADPALRREVEEYGRALAFTTVVDRAIAPDVKVTEQDATAYYERHKAEFTAPEMLKLDGIAFGTPREAQAALDKLAAGTDFAWLRSSAPGQLPPDRRSLQLDGATVSAGTLPAELRKALTNATAGAYRLYAARPDEVYVVRVIEQRPAAPQPYLDAREKIAKKLYNEKLTAAIGEYAGKLRKAQPVDVYVTRVTL